ncbi:MAG: efflux RND transporter permease subunit, partial [Eubacteriales bacterium]|nr:efflux RND transporter permease subunit [Eubacteriales bacterium]
VGDIAAALIPLPTGGSVRLSEIAAVMIEPKEQTNIAKMDGEPCVMLAVNKQSGVNTVQVATRVLRQMDRIAAENPSLVWAVLMDQSDYINLSVDQAMSNIVYGVILAALVLLVFLRSFGSTAVISVAMPMCIVSVFLIMKAGGLTLNMMSLGGITMGVGMIVDNSIVVLENIYSYRSDGYSRYESCVLGTGEVALSISASTLTTVAVFLPLGLTGGLVGMLFKDFCVTIAGLLLSSLVIALTLVPLLCYMLLDRNDKKQLKRAKKRKESKAAAGANRAIGVYRRVLGVFVRRRWIAVLTSIGLVVVFIGTIALCSFELMPSMDQGMVQISVSMPIGTELEECEAVSNRILEIAE